MKIDLVLNGKKGFVFFTNEEDGKQDVLMVDTAQYLFFLEVDGKAALSSQEEPTGISIASYTKNVEESRELWDYFINQRFQTIDMKELNASEQIFVVQPKMCAIT